MRICIFYFENILKKRRRSMAPSWLFFKIAVESFRVIIEVLPRGTFEAGIFSLRRNRRVAVRQF